MNVTKPAVRIFRAKSAEADLDAIVEYFGDLNPVTRTEEALTILRVLHGRQQWPKG